MSVEHLRTGDRANVLFRFIKSPEYLRLGMKLVFREGRTKAIGSVSKLIPHVAPQSTNNRSKTRLQTTTTVDQSQPSKRTDNGDDSNRSLNKRPKQTKTTTDMNTSIEQETDIEKNTS
jgi:hypothetical protein